MNAGLINMQKAQVDQTMPAVIKREGGEQKEVKVEQALSYYVKIYPSTTPILINVWQFLPVQEQNIKSQ